MPEGVELVFSRPQAPILTSRKRARYGAAAHLPTFRHPQATRKLPLSSNSLYHLRANWQPAMCSRKRSFHGSSMPGRIHGHAGADFAG